MDNTKILTDSSIINKRYVRAWHDIFEVGDTMVFEDDTEAVVEDKPLMWFGTPVYRVNKDVFPERGQIVFKKKK